jgi:hypothetical protein
MVGRSHGLVATCGLRHVLAFGGLSTLEAAAYWLFGLSLWTLIEYILHRGLFHIDKSVYHDTTLRAY